jgi:hypothetical protein
MKAIRLPGGRYRIPKSEVERLWRPVKSCRIPVDAPKDLIDAYFEALNSCSYL